MSASRKQILFVDDEQRVLDGLRRMLRNKRKTWDMVFVTSGQDALDHMAKHQVDVIVSDMRMPGMSGEELLSNVRELHPSAVRLVLSGQADKEEILKSTGPIHQFLQKPCEAEMLVSAISRTIELGDMFTNEHLKSIVSGLETLPSLPSHQEDLISKLEMEEPSPKLIGEAISKDLAMSTKILQLVNSAFFGLRRHVKSPAEAVVILGIETVKSLVLTMQVFAQISSHEDSEFSQDSLLRHSAEVASCARKICHAEQMSKTETETIYLAGLLHDIGKLVIATELPEEFKAIRQRIKNDDCTPMSAEREVLGVTHSEIGGYLLGLWAFDAEVVDAAVYHHCPEQHSVEGFTSVTAVHAANALVHNNGPNDETTFLMNHDYISKLDLADHIESWASACGRVA